MHTSSIKWCVSNIDDEIAHLAPEVVLVLVPVQAKPIGDVRIGVEKTDSCHGVCRLEGWGVQRVSHELSVVPVN